MKIQGIEVTDGATAEAACEVQEEIFRLRLLVVKVAIRGGLLLKMRGGRWYCGESDSYDPFTAVDKEHGRKA